MIQNLLNRIANGRYKKLKDALPQTQTSFTISNQNAQSWDPETHPDGRGDSHLVSTIDYDEQSGNLDVEYRDGFKARYENIDKETAEAFNRAPSKGRFALRKLWGLDYKPI